MDDKYSELYRITFRTVQHGQVIAEKIEDDRALFTAAIAMIRDCQLRGVIPDRFSMTKEANDQLFPMIQDDSGDIAVVEEFVGLPCSIDLETKGIIITLHVASSVKAFGDMKDLPSG